MLTLMKNLWTDDSGQALAEYGTVLGVMAIGAIAIIIAFRTQLGTVFTAIGNSLSQQLPASGS